MTWRPIRTAPTDGTSVILAVPISHGDGWAIGEARYVEHIGGTDTGWWWANTDPGDYYADPIYEADSDGALWQPMPDRPAPRDLVTP